MTVKSPETYGEHYWSSQVEAAAIFDETLEQGVKPFVPHIFADPGIREAMPFDILPKIESMLEFPTVGLAAVGGRFVSEVADQAVGMVMTPALRKTQYAANRLFDNLLMGPDQAITLFRRGLMVQEDMDRRFRNAGYNVNEQLLLMNAASPYPGLPDLFRWARYHGSPENIWGTLSDSHKIDPLTYPLWDWVGQQQYATDQITTMFRRGTILDIAADEMLMQLGWTRDKTATIRDLSYLVPNAMICLQGNLLADATEENIFEDLGHGDIHPDYQQKYFDAVLTKPAAMDLISYHLRQENDLADLNDDLRRIGIHPKYFDTYKTLSYVIPPLNDIISMAVREAFSPAIAERFGQYEDFPQDFARYAGMQGLSEDWAKRYWAAHWALPSATQGFEMLHRGIITREELTLLLKAQDVMPFWRDRLIQMAFKPLTRVDVRRMYREGVLDESEVYEAYLNVGYEADNARRMTEFTIRQTLSTMSKFTSADVVKAYTDRMIDRSETRSLLNMLKVRSADITYILSTADYKRSWALADARTGAIRNLYRRAEYDDNQARSELLRLDLPSDQVEMLMEKWWFEAKEDKPPTFSKAETLKFLKVGLIDETRARKELRLMEYDQEHIDLYIKALTWKPPE